jgi:two-component system sensor histidine kinase DegS
VAQEALTNVGRHAQATDVRISIRQVAGAVALDISDNGRSFPVEKVLQARNPRRLGLVGMRERLEMVGGTLAIESARGTGTSVHARIPFRAEAPSA